MLVAAGELSEFKVLEPISEGQFGSVHLALWKGKIVALKKTPILNRNEVLIHSAIQHENIITLHETFSLDNLHYMAMEYAAGVPDIGVDEELAQFYFHQLLAGVEYLHSKGIAHRDLKPENILLDQTGNLKICDFGLSTVFCKNGVHRRLTTVCGTKPYVAPEVLFGNYDGPLADIWSCGIILLVLSTGMTAWDEPTEDSPEFVTFCTSDNIANLYPWNKLDVPLRELICGMCCIFEAQRYNIHKIKSHPWVRKQNRLNGRGRGEHQALTRLLSQLHLDECDMFASQMDIFSQQPAPENNGVSFSQPTAFISTYRSETHINLSQPDKAVMSATSLTRFYAYTETYQIMDAMATILTDFLVSFKKAETSIQFNTVDKRKCILTGDIVVQSTANNLLLVNFRRTKGDPLEFRRFFVGIRSELGDLVCKEE